MKQIGKRTILLGAAALCWGIMFPEYTFTTDSYTMFMQEAEYVEDANEAEGIEGAESVEELLRAVREGKVRYRFRFYEYLKNYLFSRSENESDWDVFLRRELCLTCRDAGFERGIIYLWSIRDETDMRRSEYLTPESAG